MHFLIITYDEYVNIPYIKKYEQLILENNDTYDIVLWDRRGLKYPHPSNHIMFEANAGKTKASKIVPFIRLRKLIKNTMKETHYDKLIVLTTIPALLIFDKLLLRYKGQYLLDYRDYTYENFYPYKKFVNLVAQGAAIVSISSKAFLEVFKKKENFIVTHNITNIKDANNSYQALVNDNTITISFVGGVRYFEENCKLLLQFKNNVKFKLQYIGKVHPGCDLQKFCREHQINNVEFFPEYNNDQKPEIYNKVDLINAIYGNKTNEVVLALPNKLYDCVLFKKPIIVSKNTYVSKIVKQYYLGIAVDIEKDDVAAMIEDFYRKFDIIKFEKGCLDFLQIAIQEEKECNSQIEYFIKKEVI
ncbi:MAG: hypothetical protein VB100_04620 [Angelakisella sp.]|nr:hypothetical protein [Angelakisella sp.]